MFGSRQLGRKRKVVPAVATSADADVSRVQKFFLVAAARLPERRFLLGGSGWESRGLPVNVRHLGHVSTRDHNAFNVTPLAVLNIARESMAAVWPMLQTIARSFIARMWSIVMMSLLPVAVTKMSARGAASSIVTKRAGSDITVTRHDCDEWASPRP